MLLDGENQCGDALDKQLVSFCFEYYCFWLSYGVFKILEIRYFDFCPTSSNSSKNLIRCRVNFLRTVLNIFFVILCKSVTRWACVRNLYLRGLQSVLQNRALALKNCGRQQYLEPQNLRVQKLMSQRSTGSCTCCTHANAFSAEEFMVEKCWVEKSGVKAWG